MVDILCLEIRKVTFLKYNSIKTLIKFKQTNVLTNSDDIVLMMTL